ncbi:conserved hypothetical protein [Ricinus communis]|uniref:Uncharacterized protein n=1 Tax=Ricinus communis TaxID=3988 RepID=B9RU64_RICCO|nr:conserved hypothetical protein [Ricinus communis]
MQGFTMQTTTRPMTGIRIREGGRSSQDKGQSKFCKSMFNAGDIKGKRYSEP